MPDSAAQCQWVEIQPDCRAIVVQHQNRCEWAIHAFPEEGLACLVEKSHRPNRATFSFDETGLTRLPATVARSPCDHGLDDSLWSLERLAQVCHAEGLTDARVSYETMRHALQRAGIDWKRTRKRTQRTDAGYANKKASG